MFKKILIANRGEIACRVIKTARRMGIATVAVYSAVDRQARHVRLADEAVSIEAASGRDAYLNGEGILAAARDTGAQAIHPGYGFLAENAGFAAACGNAGVVFIGPPTAAIEAMGSKSAAKGLMEKAAVPLTPGYHGDDQSPALLAKEAQRIGYPVLIKASAGGGGKGMRRVDKLEDFMPALESCKREAIGAFGDDRVLVEKYIVRPRHIEIQVFGDTQGEVVYLFERDCSVQRRHQKVLEEAPAPGMTPQRRAAMGKAACDAAKAVGYVGAGTVEFIVHQDGVFYFMEMNTRLQVEHPVTEMITGLDLVEWQLRVAAGEPLPLRQEQLSITGHSIEARVYAEDPSRGFLPSTGRLIHLVPPPESDHVRVDTGVEQGDEITPYYDPMVAKLIVRGRNRDEALARMRVALEQYQIVGISNNIEFLGRLLDTPSFANADLDTGLIERERERLFANDDAVPAEVWRLAAAAELAREAQRAKRDATSAADPGSPWRLHDHWRMNGSAQRSLAFHFGELHKEVNVELTERGQELTLDGERMAADATLGRNGRLEARLGKRRLQATVVAHGEQRHVFFEGRHWALTLPDRLQTGAADDEHEGGLKAPMPGKLIALLAQPGIEVEKGAPLLVMEAMKMEHTVCAPARGMVKTFRYAPGDQVTEGTELAVFEAAVGRGEK